MSKIEFLDFKVHHQLEESIFFNQPQFAGTYLVSHRFPPRGSQILKGKLEEKHTRILGVNSIFQEEGRIGIAGDGYNDYPCSSVWRIEATTNPLVTKTILLSNGDKSFLDKNQFINKKMVLVDDEPLRSPEGELLFFDPNMVLEYLIGANQLEPSSIETILTNIL